MNRAIANLLGNYDLKTQDVQPFLKDKQELELWSRGFFLDIIESTEII